MRALLLTVLLAVAAPSFGQVVSCFSSERFDQELVNVGDSERKVLELEPDREVRLENHYGAAAGYRYDFYKRGRTIQIYVRSGVIYRICRVPD
ncbi:MAG: hypothetical protein RQ741_11155 [Wenzhouxiangellaceae bacterium]|nr:hypothetical protein [Wenzhouxiangellaceae bacterium]